MEVSFTSAGRTDTGVSRPHNEDGLFMAPDRGIFVVADGMGGHVAGAVASAMAVELVSRGLGSLRALDDAQAAERMRRAIQAANGAILRRTVAEPDKRGMGTTVTALALYGARYIVGHVGDSRAYLLRDGRLVRITTDHSVVQLLVDAGHLSPEDARSHHFRNVITRAVGTGPNVVPDIHVGGPVRPGDVFLLASDGLTSVLDDERLASMMSPAGEPGTQVDALVDLANRGGGRDNVTVVIVRVDTVERAAHAA